MNYRTDTHRATDRHPANVSEGKASHATSQGPAMKVYQAINKVASDLAAQGVKKAQENKFDGYKFRGIDDVYNALAPLLARHGLCVLPRMLSRQVVERESAKGGALFYVTVDAEFDFVSAEDGTKHTVRTFGEAMDRGDKATNKAMSAAYKYAAFQTFCIPTEGDNDTENQTHEVKASAPKHSPMPAALDADPVKVSKVVSAVCDLYEVSVRGDDVSYALKETLAGLEQEEKLAVWAALKSQSKIRAWIKEQEKAP